MTDYIRYCFSILVPVLVNYIIIILSVCFSFIGGSLVLVICRQLSRTSNIFFLPNCYSYKTLVLFCTLFPKTQYHAVVPGNFIFRVKPSLVARHLVFIQGDVVH